MRVFFSIQPAPGVCLDIERWRDTCWPNLSRPVPVQNFHMTLAFLGDIHSDQLNQLMDDVDGITLPKISLVLNQVGYWSKPDVLWLGTSEPVTQLSMLAKHCKRLANRVGIKVESNKFAPHITLARRLIQPPPGALINPEFNFELTQLSLIESTLHPTGSRFRELVSWE